MPRGDNQGTHLRALIEAIGAVRVVSVDADLGWVIIRSKQRHLVGGRGRGWDWG